jgi:hypothetical protein
MARLKKHISSPLDSARTLLYTRQHTELGYAPNLEVVLIHSVFCFSRHPTMGSISRKFHPAQHQPCELN